MTNCPAWQDNDGLLVWGLIQMEDLNDFALLVAVVDHGSFSAAGRALGFPRSKVSRRVADLEQRLGVRLLQRSTRAVSLTEVGAEFYTHCKSITRSAQWALDVAERATQHPSGRIRVSCPTGVAHLFLAELLPRFVLAHPDVQVDLELTSRRVELIAEGIDVAIRVRSSLDDSGLILRSFGVSRQALVASPGFVHAHGPFASAAALHEVLGMGPRGVNGEPPRWRLTSPQGTSELVDYRSRLFTEDVELLHHAALAGMGVAQLPLALCRGSVVRGELVVLLGDHTLPVHQLHAVYPSRRGLAPGVRALIEFLVDVLPAVLESAEHDVSG